MHVNRYIGIDSFCRMSLWRTTAQKTAFVKPVMRNSRRGPIGHCPERVPSHAALIGPRQSVRQDNFVYSLFFYYPKRKRTWIPAVQETAGHFSLTPKALFLKNSFLFFPQPLHFNFRGLNCEKFQHSTVSFISQDNDQWRRDAPWQSICANTYRLLFAAEGRRGVRQRVTPRWPQHRRPPRSRSWVLLSPLHLSARSPHAIARRPQPRKIVTSLSTPRLSTYIIQWWFSKNSKNKRLF